MFAASRHSSLNLFVVIVSSVFASLFIRTLVFFISYQNPRKKKRLIIPVGEMGPKSSPFWIASPDEEAKKRRSQQCIEEASRTGLKSAAIACVVATIPTLAAVRMVPWAKANINHTGQALIISAASIATYVITTDKAMLECARKNTHYDRSA